jgi:hypothetical protein
MNNIITSIEMSQLEVRNHSLHHELPGEIPAIMSADYILERDWPEPIWAVPGILPVGFAILAGAPKVGKSWLALQIAQAVAAGGFVLNQRVEEGPVLYLALEDSPRRLKERMKKQNWLLGLDADFIHIGGFPRTIGDLNKGGDKKLVAMIEKRNYRLVVVDTLSRAFKGDQLDAGDMTTDLTPVQEIAHEYNMTILLVDHHKKRKGEAPDAIGDILGSTAKGAMADTILGLYRERGKLGAKLSITGRDVEEKAIDLIFDKDTGCWQLSTKNNGVTPQQDELHVILKNIGPISVSELADAVERNRGSVYKQLVALAKDGKAKQLGEMWSAIDGQ